MKNKNKILNLIRTLEVKYILSISSCIVLIFYFSCTIKENLNHSNFKLIKEELKEGDYKRSSHYLHIYSDSLHNELFVRSYFNDSISKTSNETLHDLVYAQNIIDPNTKWGERKIIKDICGEICYVEFGSRDSIKKYHVLAVTIIKSVPTTIEFCTPDSETFIKKRQYITNQIVRMICDSSESRNLSKPKK